MTGQFQWIDDRPKPYTPPKYTSLQADHDQNPLWPHPGRVPGVRRAHVDRRHTGQEVPR